MSKYQRTYTEEQIRQMITEHGGIRATARFINMNTTVWASESGIRSFLKKCEHDRRSETSSEATAGGDRDKPVAAGNLHAPDAVRKTLAGTRFVFTAAQNNTYVNENFLASLLVFCEAEGATLNVSRFTYNKSGFQNSTKDSDGLWYDARLAEFFVDESVQVARNLVFGGELDIIPTATNPLSGFETYFMGSSGIVPHAKLALESLPRMKDEDARFLYTTGAITQRNYIQRKAGQKAEFHHVYGALYVEIDSDGDWFARQLVADKDGQFYDLDTLYTPTGFSRNQSVLAINYGDIHIEKMDGDVANGVWYSEQGSLQSILRPTYHFIHDLTDFTARNHHNIKDPYFLAEQHFSQKSSVEDNITLSAEFLQELNNMGGMVVVVESNHDQAFQRWLREADIRQDPENARYFHEMNAEIYRNIAYGPRNFSIYEYALREKEKLDNVIFLKEDDSFVIANDPEIEDETGEIVGGIECGMHGHRGINGARGSSRSLSKVGRKVNLGHSHSASIIDGAYTAGVSGMLDMGYNKGPSSWSHSHILTYHNGKRTIITMRGRKWRANT